MRKIKKASALALSLALCLSVCACQSTAEPADQSTTTAAPTSENSDASTDFAESSDATEAVITEDEAKILAESLMEDRIFIDYTLMRAGLTTDSENVIEYNGIHYAPVTESGAGYTCTDDLKAEIAAVFTADYIGSRYYMDDFDGMYPMYIDYEGALYMNIDGGGGGYEEYAYDNLVIESVSTDEISGSVPGQTAYGQQITCSFTLSNAEGSWKICAMNVTDGQ